MAQQSEVTVIPKRIGGSMAIFLPAEVVRRRRIKEGVPVRVTISADKKTRVLGALKRRTRHRRFDRHAEGFWPES
jgi:antitoxin component of MazEF toxin-antitoxin module